MSLPKVHFYVSGTSLLLRDQLSAASYCDPHSRDRCGLSLVVHIVHKTKMTLLFSAVPSGATIKPEPYTLHIPEQDIADFKALLRLSKVGPETYENTQASGRLGISREWLAQAKHAWETKFDWRAQEQRINAVPNFKATVEDPDSGPISIHFAALFSRRSDAVPLICMHGWPGSFLEFLPMLNLLQNKYTPDTLPYHIVVPSLPGYAMSSGPPLDREFTLLDVARILNRLMVGLGFGRGYIAQGGDIGSMLARILSYQHTECKAFHGEFCGPYMVTVI
jgi:microsomal epoxide hydrolase